MTAVFIARDRLEDDAEGEFSRYVKVAEKLGFSKDEVELESSQNVCTVYSKDIGEESHCLLVECPCEGAAKPLSLDICAPGEFERLTVLMQDLLWIISYVRVPERQVSVFVHNGGEPCPGYEEWVADHLRATDILKEWRFALLSAADPKRNVLFDLANMKFDNHLEDESKFVGWISDLANALTDSGGRHDG